MPAYLEQADLRDATNIVAIDDATFRRASVVDANFGDITDDAAKATQAEHNMTLLEGLRSYPKAVGWSILISTAVVMEGFDTILIGL
jgi:SP family general alpha glucoside:H+ symporter-like MFS transporter